MTAESTEALAAYPSGHHPAVLRTHARRTARDCADHLIPYLRDGQRILDVGCGPGSITLSFLEFSGPSGTVTGVDPGEPAIRQAQQAASSQGVGDRATFSTGDALAGLPFADGSFDVVHAHQVVQHVADPVALIKEMLRLAKRPGGIVSLRESELESMIWYPDQEILRKQFIPIWTQVARSRGAQPAAGRRIHAWALQAGVKREELVHVGAGTWCYGQKPGDEGKEERAWWSGTMEERIRNPDSGIAKTAREMGLCSQDDLDNIAQAWREWGASEDAWFAMLHGTVIIKLV